MVHVLIADDDPVSRRMLEVSLRNEGYPVSVATNGAEALQFLEQEDGPRLAVLDWMMPEVDGVDVCRIVRESDREAYVYIILLTARGHQSEIVQGFAAGADDYVVKPFDLHELKARLRVGLRLLQLEDNLVQAREAMRFKASHDALTEVWNRGAILEMLNREIIRSRREDTSLGVLIADLDHFKAINDTRGHLVGDHVLREVTKRMQGAIRAYDSVGRYGGEEFVVLTPGCDSHQTMEKAERLRNAISEHPIETPGGPVQVTLSFGGISTADYPLGDANQILQAADAALYRAKQEGRNRTAMACAPDPNVSAQPPIEVVG